jgi:hypothetical protein
MIRWRLRDLPWWRLLPDWWFIQQRFESHAVRCHHRSHRLRLRCWRTRTYDGFCGRHNDTCFSHCPSEDKPKS